jgi:DNA-binding response OmpR family regulator
MNKNILIIEDDIHIIELLRHYLSKEHFQVLSATDGKAGLAIAKSKRPLLIVLDLMLPEMDGFAVCRQLRNEADTSHIPILILTAKAEEFDKIVGLEIGADDYVTKPFSLKELVARINALLRRYERRASVQRRYLYGKLELDVETHDVKYGGKTIELTSKEFALLQTLLQNGGRLLTRENILQKVWGEDYYGSGRTVDVHIRKLREKLPDLTSDIETIKGLGYKLKSK